MAHPDDAEPQDTLTKDTKASMVKGIGEDGKLRSIDRVLRLLQKKEKVIMSRDRGLRLIKGRGQPSSH